MPQNTITTIVGRKGSGKSELTHEVIDEHPRVVILDTVGEYGARDGAVVAEGYAASLAALEAAGRAQRFRISLRVEDPHHGAAIAGIVHEFRRVLFVVEEASEFISPSHLPASFKRLVLRGRHREISQLYVAQRPALLHRSVTSQSDVIVTFQQHGARDLDYLGDVFSDEQLEQIRTLAEYKCAAAGPGLARAAKAIRRRLAA